MVNCNRSVLTNLFILNYTLYLNMYILDIDMLQTLKTLIKCHRNDMLSDPAYSLRGSSRLHRNAFKQMLKGVRVLRFPLLSISIKKVSEYDPEIQHSQTAKQSTALRGRVTNQ